MHRSYRVLLLHLITLSDTPHSVGLLWTTDRPVAAASACAIHDTRMKQISMPLARFELAVPPNDLQLAYALDRVAKWIGLLSEPCH